MHVCVLFMLCIPYTNVVYVVYVYRVYISVMLVTHPCTPRTDVAYVCIPHIHFLWVLCVHIYCVSVVVLMHVVYCRDTYSGGMSVCCLCMSVSEYAYMLCVVFMNVCCV